MKQMLKGIVTLALSLMLSAPVTTFGQVVFSDGFDAQPDWASKQLTIGGITWGTTYERRCTVNCPPVGWTSYRVAKSLWTPNLRDTYVIDTLGARGGSGKGLTYNVESSGTWGTWAGGAIDKYLGPTGYQELYVRFWMKESAEFCWGSELLNENALGKFLRISALRRDPTTDAQLFNPQLYPSPDTSPCMMADAYRRFQPNYGIPPQFNVSERFAPNYESGPGTTYPAQIPSDITTGGKGYCGDDKWHSYEFYVRMNSALDVADGAYRVWLDGKLVAEKTTVPWVKSGIDSNGTVMSVATGWNWVMLADNVNSTAYPRTDMKEMARYIDDFVISTHYSGPPAVPTAVTAKSDASTVSLTWANGSNGASYLVDGYHIYYGTDPQNLTNRLTVGAVNQAEITDLAATTYYFAIAGYNKSSYDSQENEGLRSAAVSATVTGNPLPSADAVPPVAAIVTPAPGSTLTGQVAMEASASDNVGVSKVEFYRNGSLFGMVGSAPYSLSWNTATSTDGSYTLVAKAYDAAGNAGASSSVTVSVSNGSQPKAPTVKIVSPGYGSTVRGAVAIQTAASTNTEKVELYVNGTLKASTSSAPFTLTWNTLALANNAYSVKTKAYDAAGNVGESSAVTLYVDNSEDTTAPTVNLTSVTAGGLRGTSAVTAAATDDVAVTKVEFYVNGTLQATSVTAPYSFTWDTATVTDGDYTLTAKAYDAAGNVAQSAQVGVKVLNDYAKPVVSITSQSSGSNVTVSANATDNAGVQRVELYLDGHLKATSSSAPHLFTLDTLTLANGVHSLSATAFDAAGNVGDSNSITINVMNDRFAPGVTSFLMPAIKNATTVEVTAFAANDDVAVTGYLITESATVPSLTDTGWSPTAPASFIFYGTGSRTAYAWAKDAAGHVSAASTATVIVDTVLPIISSMTLVDGASFVTVKASAMDNIAVSKMELYVDDLLQLQTSESSLSYASTSTSSRSQRITLKVYDSAGNMRSRSLRISKF